MKKKKQYSYDYSSLNLKSKVVWRFKKLARKLARSQSDTLEAMLHFFEWHGFSPDQKFEKRFMGELLKNRKRTEANIAILRSIEQTQTKPLSIQMDMLFQGRTEQEAPPERIEKKFAGREGDRPDDGEKIAMVPKAELRRAQDEIGELKGELAHLLEKVKTASPPIGKKYLRLDMEPSRFETLRAKLERKLKS